MKKTTKTIFSLKQRLDFICNKAINNGVFPGAAVGFSEGQIDNREVLIATYGKVSLLSDDPYIEVDTFFDLASLTKPLATTLAILCLLSEGKIALDEKLPSMLNRKDLPLDKIRISLKHILSHSAGFAAHRPYFIDLVSTLPEKRKEILVENIIADPLEYEPGSRSLYSDLGFMLLGYIVELKSGQPLDFFLKNKIYNPLDLDNDLVFHPLFDGKNNMEEKRFAYTENCGWRKKYLCGEVHDDNASVMGGVAGHAGLFGTIKGVLFLTTALLDYWKDRKIHPCFNNRDLREFLVRQDWIPGTTRTLGFDTPSFKNSSAGKYFSPTSVGHLGFTGTSFWIDPQKDCVVVLLTNRVHPTSDNNAIQAFRPLLHDTIMQWCAENKE